MNRKNNLDYDFLSGLAIAGFTLLQVLRWKMFPQFMDFYYHIHTAWGFVQAGGYSSWDFWQYAPFGRPHIYPPALHLLLAFFLKLGFSPVILAKALEALLPPVFLFSVWFFIRKEYGRRLALFFVITFASSMSFYLSLSNNIPATLALLCGIWAYSRLIHKKVFSAALLLALSFYFHISVPWVFVLAFFFIILFEKKSRKTTSVVLLLGLLLSLPVFYRQITALRSVSLGGALETQYSEFKPLEYALATIGIFYIWRLRRDLVFFISLLLGSFFLILYPYRFFSAQGYFPVILLAASGLEGIVIYLSDKKIKKLLVLLLCCYLFFFSVTIFVPRIAENNANPRAYLADTAFVDMLLPGHNPRLASTSLWYPDEYLYALRVIRENSSDAEIIYSPSYFISVCLAAISGRATAGALFPEIGPSAEFDPFSVSRVIILTQDQRQENRDRIIARYGLRRLGESKIFAIYLNPSPSGKMQVKEASLTFAWVICIIIFVVLAALILERKTT